VHVTQTTLDHLGGQYEVEQGQGLREHNVASYFIVPPPGRKKSALFSTSLRNAMLSGGKRKPSFKMVSNLVVQLLHSVKFSVEVPFSDMAERPVEMQKNTVAKKVGRTKVRAALEQK